MLSGEDITDQRRAESEAHRALERMNSVSRLATMGEMAAGISHELNQPLAAIANYAQACVRLLRMPAPDMPEIAGALEQIAGQALRAGEIIRRIRSLVRNEDVRREAQDINELIREVHGAAGERCARARRQAGARSRHAAAAGHGRRRADPAGAHESGAQRIRSAGTRSTTALPFEVRIATRLTEPATSKCRSATSGPGLAGEVEQKIFEPFFTTKATGTGLGLAISRSIIKAHDARLGYRANQPRGACFYFVLPAHQETPP